MIENDFISSGNIVEVSSSSSSELEETTENEPQTEDVEGENTGSVAVVDEIPEQLTKDIEVLDQQDKGFQSLVDQAYDKGVTEETISRVQEEYLANNKLSDRSYQELAKAGYSKSFIEAYISGQEAIIKQYMISMVDFAGGKEQYDSLCSHLESTSKDSLVALEKAISNRDITTVKAIINLARQSFSNKFGTIPKRTVTNITPVVTNSSNNYFRSQREMIDAINDPRYQNDSYYQQEVDQKIINSNKRII